MAGRPPTPIRQKIANGDTRKLGANKFKESLGGFWEPRRGRPKFPAGLLFRASRPIAGEPEGVAAQRVAIERAEKKRLLIARTHWKYIADQLEAEGKLAVIDEGVLTGLALSYALLIEAGRAGDVKAYKEVSQRYMQAADRMGLNESARARLPVNDKSGEVDPLMEQIGPRLQTA